MFFGSVDGVQPLRGYTNNETKVLGHRHVLGAKVYSVHLITFTGWLYKSQYISLYKFVNSLTFVPTKLINRVVCNAL